MSIIQSPYEKVDIPDISITRRLFDGLEGRAGDVVLTDGPTGATTTAGELTDRIERLAGGLSERGFGKGRTVALMAPNIPDYVTVFHAVTWAGGTVTTINPTYTAHEVRKQLTDSGATLLVVHEAVLDTAREAAEGTGIREIAVIGAAGDATALDDLMGAAQKAQAEIDLDTHVVVLPYSSGTTGLPKGVMLTHRNLVANVEQCLKAIPMQPGETIVAFLPFFHIYGMTALMNLTLAGRGALVTMPRFELELFLQLVERHRTPKLYLVPPVVLALAKHPMVERFDLSAVAQIVCGAAPLGGELADAAARRIGATTTQAYGMTELSPVSHATPLDRPRSGSSGVNVPNTDCRIVDPETRQDRAPGEEGELWVRGPQVMKGYLGNETATAETIVDGWLRTGDLAVFDEDGFVFIRERVKELIKYKGFQVAPAELEAELVSHDGVADAAVLGRPDDEAGEVPVAFVVAADGASLSEDDVKALIAGKLSSYKRLHEVHFVDEIPKSASGKILRRILRDRLAG